MIIYLHHKSPMIKRMKKMLSGVGIRCLLIPFALLALSEVVVSCSSDDKVVFEYEKTVVEESYNSFDDSYIYTREIRYDVMSDSSTNSVLCYLAKRADFGKTVDFGIVSGYDDRVKK